MAEFDLSTLTGLISRYSPSGSEQEVVEWLVGRMRALHYDQAFMDDAGNAVGVIGCGERQIILLGHIDTVPGEIPIRQEDNILYGRGCVDAKGPLACFVDATAHVGRRNGWQLVVIGAVEEERDSDGARYVVNHYKPDMVIVGEPNRWDRIALGYKGSIWIEVTLKREQSHTASGKMTAAEKAIALWLKFQSFADTFNMNRKKVFDKLLLSLSDLNSRSDDFSQTVKMRISARLPIDLPPDQWLAEIKTMLTGEEATDIQVVSSNHPISAWKGEKNTAVVRAFLKAIRGKGGTPRFVYKTGTADINIVAPVWRCPAVVYGPGDSKLDHTPNEHIDLSEYRNAVEVLASVLHNLTNA